MLRRAGVGVHGDEAEKSKKCRHADQELYRFHMGFHNFAPRLSIVLAKLAGRVNKSRTKRGSMMDKKQTCSRSRQWRRRWVTAWLLRDACEGEPVRTRHTFLAGHTHTVMVRKACRCADDTGFRKFNRPTPLPSALFDHLGVASYPTDMSFAASIDSGRLEYAGTDINTLLVNAAT